MGSLVQLTVWDGQNVTVKGKVVPRSTRGWMGYRLRGHDERKPGNKFGSLVQTVQARAAEYGAEKRYLQVAKF